MALQEAAEAYLVTLFEDTKSLCNSCQRGDNDKDLQLAKESGDRLHEMISSFAAFIL